VWKTKNIKRTHPHPYLADYADAVITEKNQPLLLVPNLERNPQVRKKKEN
jgi:hypothetical protein